MQRIITSCPFCTELNEAEPAGLPPGVRTISCWSCARTIPVPDRPDPELQRPAAFTTPSEAKKSSLPPPPPPKDTPAHALPERGLFLVIGVGAAIFLLLGVAGFLVVRSFTPRASTTAGSQLRGAYHSGSERPEGTVAWRAKLAPGSDFAPACLGDDLIIAVANEPRSGMARSYTPTSVPEDVLPRIRELHGRMLTEGYRSVSRPTLTALQQEEQQRVRVTLQSGTCYHVAALASEAAEDVDLLLYQPDGYSLIVADTRGERDAYVEHCSERTGEYQLELRMARGHGPLVYTRYLQTEEDCHDTGHVYSIDAKTGVVRWDRELDRAVATSPATSDDAVVVGVTSRRRSAALRKTVHGGALVVLEPNDGTTRCAFEAEGPVASSPAIHKGVAYFGTCGPLPQEGRSEAICTPDSKVPSAFYGVSLGDCGEDFRFLAADPVITPPATDGIRVYFVAGSRLYALSLADGSLSWTYDAPAVLSSPSVSNGKVLVGAQNGAIIALDADDGSVAWSFAADSSIPAASALSEQAALVASTDGTVFAFDLNNGERLWDLRAPAYARGPLAVAANLAMILTSTEVIGAEMTDGTEAFRIPLGGTVGPGSALILRSGILYISTASGELIAVR